MKNQNDLTTPVDGLRLHWRSGGDECRACLPLMRELRPDLSDPQAFVEQLDRQAAQGYRLLVAQSGEEIVGLAGCRLQENLLYGRYLYIDDLICRSDRRGQGIGERLIAAARDEAKNLGCKQFVLDTALGNALAQRFYFRQGLLATGMHFRQAL